MSKADESPPKQRKIDAYVLTYILVQVNIYKCKAKTVKTTHKEVS